MTSVATANSTMATKGYETTNHGGGPMDVKTEIEDYLEKRVLGRPGDAYRAQCSMWGSGGQTNVTPL